MDNLKIIPGETQKVDAVLKPIPAELEVVSIPPKARIYVNNEFKGEAPVTIRTLAPGSYRVRAELQGHDIIFRDIEIKAATKITEEFRLAENVGAIYISTEPPGVKILVDGKETGITVAKGGETNLVSDICKIEKVSVGRHEVKLTKKSFDEKTISLVVEKDKIVSQHVRLEYRFVPDYEVITTTGVVRGRLIWIHEGSVKMEVAPGVFRAIPVNNIKNKRPLG
jgi:hypothetical protein